MPISISTLFGVGLGALVIVLGISTATTNPKAFLDVGSFLIVLGGTITSTFIGFRWRYIFKALMSIPSIFVQQKINPNTLKEDVRRVIGWNKKIQESGAKALDELSSDSKEEDFVRYMFGLVATGYKEDEVRVFCTTAIEEEYFRNLQQPNILAYMAAGAPAFGMLGTLIGLIAMLERLDDPSKMGPGLAVALITTLYGVIAARFIFLPASTKVKQLLGIKRFRNYLLLEGVTLIMSKRSAMFIQDRLNSFLDAKNRLEQGDGKDSISGR